MSKRKISEKQLIANQQNCQKSTGPKTDEGKKIVARNAIKYGLHAKDIIINSTYLKEDPAEYDALLKAFLDELNPTTSAQIIIVHKIANCFWRSRRATAAETAYANAQLNDLGSHYRYGQLTSQINQIPELPDDPNIHDEMQETRKTIARSMSDIVTTQTIPRPELCMKILYYEMRINRQLEHYFRILWNLQGKKRDDVFDQDTETKTE